MKTVDVLLFFHGAVFSYEKRTEKERFCYWNPQIAFCFLFEAKAWLICGGPLQWESVAFGPSSYQLPSRWFGLEVRASLPVSHLRTRTGGRASNYLEAKGNRAAKSDTARQKFRRKRKETQQGNGQKGESGNDMTKSSQQQTTTTWNPKKGSTLKGYSSTYGDYDSES